MITYQEALSLIIKNCRLFPSETVPLAAAYGRILAENITSDRDYPPFNRSAMDGYAFHTKDWEKGVRNFLIKESIYAGQESKSSLETGECYKIMTGAAVPSSANVVIRREDTEERAGNVVIHADSLKEFQNIARQGEDLKKNAIILETSTKCTPSVISALATTGRTDVLVRKLPRVALFTTGDEVVDVNVPVSPVQIRNSNKYLLLSLLKKWGISPVIVEHIPDNKTALEISLKKGIEMDMVLMCGGVSAGDADYVPEILSSLGVENLFHKVAIRPGKPIWCGKLPNGGMAFALPGNPFSCLVTFTVFVEAYLHLALRNRERATSSGFMKNDRAKKHPLTEFVPVKRDKSGNLDPLKFNGSGDIRAGLGADSLVIHPNANNLLKNGDSVDYLPFV